MSIKIVKGNYSSVMDSASLTGNRTITLPNSTGTVALTNQLSKVATSNNYNDLSNRPALKTVATSGSYNDLSNRPALKPVATSGSYNDLTNKPTIPATPQGYITQTWHSGANWYRVWSDGFIEQGGWGKQTAANQTFKNFGLNRSFNNTNYVFVASYLKDNYSYGYVSTQERSTNSVNLFVSMVPGAFLWYASGY